MSELQDALRGWELWWEDATRDEQVIVEAARRVANPDYEAATVKLANSGKLRPLFHIALTALPELYLTIAVEVVDAALGITEET